MSISSKQEFSIIIDGQTYRVKVQELEGGNLQIELNGQVHRVSLAEVEDAEEAVNTSKASAVSTPVSIVPSAQPEKPPAGIVNAITAPMPGDIVQVMVKVGDQVSQGQEVCILEAMKMKNVLRASSEGVVKSIEVSVGHSVNYGDILVQFE